MECGNGHFPCRNADSIVLQTQKKQISKEKDRDKGFCPFLISFWECAFKDANSNRQSDPDTVAVEDIEPRQLAGECSEPYKSPLSNRGVLLQKAKGKTNTKSPLCNDL